MTTNRVIEVRGLRKVYGGTIAVDAIDLDVARGEIVGIAHRSGPLHRRRLARGDRLHVSVSGSLPAHRRAGLLAHWFEDRMIPQGSVVLTGWLADDRAYSPHTLAGYEMPVDSELAYELVSALTAKFGHRRATKEGTIKDGVWQG